MDLSVKTEDIVNNNKIYCEVLSRVGKKCKAGCNWLSIM